MTKRTFFKSISSLVAAVAMAPEIAFGTRLKMPSVPEPNGFEVLSFVYLDADGNERRIADSHKMIQAMMAAAERKSTNTLNLVDIGRLMNW